MNGVDITRLAPGWRIDDAYVAVWSELATRWMDPPEPRPPLAVMGRLLDSVEDEESLLAIVAAHLFGVSGGLDEKLDPILDAMCLDCRGHFAAGSWPGGQFPADLGDGVPGGRAPCPACGGELWIPSLSEAERRIEEACRVRDALQGLGMDERAYAAARDLVNAGRGSAVAALLGRSCVWFGARRLGLGLEDPDAIEPSVLLGPALVDRIISEPAVHRGTDAYEGQDPALD